MLASSRENLNRSVEETREQTERLLAGRREELGRLRVTAEKQAKEIRARAMAEAREITSAAHIVAREVLGDGTELSRNLRELSVSLRNNAERLLRDVGLAHGAMTARLDQTAPSGQAAREGDRPSTRRSRPADEGPDDDDDLDVPEFIPGG
jgi:cell division septum initiation protein DivIVA